MAPYIIQDNDQLPCASRLPVECARLPLIIKANSSPRFEDAIFNKNAKNIENLCISKRF